jgi:hypothetical protein
MRMFWIDWRLSRAIIGQQQGRKVRIGIRQRHVASFRLLQQVGPDGDSRPAPASVLSGARSGAAPLA